MLQEYNFETTDLQTYNFEPTLLQIRKTYLQFTRIQIRNDTIIQIRNNWFTRIQIRNNTIIQIRNLLTWFTRIQIRNNLFDLFVRNCNSKHLFETFLQYKNTNSKQHENTNSKPSYVQEYKFETFWYLQEYKLETFWFTRIQIRNLLIYKNTNSKPSELQEYKFETTR